jgi:hypothetical protein
MQTSSPVNKNLLIAITVVITLVVVAVGAGIFLLVTRNGNEPIPHMAEDTLTQERANTVLPPATGPLTSEQVYEEIIGAVFRIALYNSRGTRYGWGSGFFVCETGIAVTNHHVMVGATDAVAIMDDGREFKIIGYYFCESDTNDLAVIQLDLGGEKVASLNIADTQISVGETVYVLGGPEGQPLTFVSGIVSRISTEPVRYNNYTVYGLIQYTNRIYTGNSGGPLVNAMAQVVGINSATGNDFAHFNWAIPAERINLSDIEPGRFHPLPIGVSESAQTDGQIVWFPEFPSIPDFLSVSQNARFLIGGTAEDWAIDDADSINFDYAYVYSLPLQDFISDTDKYDALLKENGFILTDISPVHDGGDEILFWFYNQRSGVSLRYAYLTDFEYIAIYIDRSDRPGERADEHDAGRNDGYMTFARFFLQINPYAVYLGRWENAIELNKDLTDMGFEYSDGKYSINGTAYVFDTEKVLAFGLPLQHMTVHFDALDLFLEDRGYERQTARVYTPMNVSIALWYNVRTNERLVIVYDFKTEILQFIE